MVCVAVARYQRIELQRVGKVHMVCALLRRISLRNGIKVVMCLGNGAVRNGLMKVIGVCNHWTDGNHQNQGQTQGEN